MKVFQTVQKRYATVGIRPSNHSITQNPLFRRRALGGCLFFLCYYISQFVYILHVANDFMQYIECVCELYASAIVFVWFMTIALKRDLLFQYIDYIEKSIDTSMMTLNYNFFLKINQFHIFQDVNIRNLKPCSLKPMNKWNVWVKLFSICWWK